MLEQEGKDLPTWLKCASEIRRMEEGGGRRIKMRDDGCICSAEPAVKLVALAVEGSG